MACHPGLDPGSLRAVTPSKACHPGLDPGSPTHTVIPGLTRDPSAP